MLCPPPSSTLFPYTTLFRSVAHVRNVDTAITRGDLCQFDDFICGRETSGNIKESGAQAECAILYVPGSFASTDEVIRSEEHTSELQSLTNLVCRLLLEKKKN